MGGTVQNPYGPLNQYSERSSRLSLPVLPFSHSSRVRRQLIILARHCHSMRSNADHISVVSTLKPVPSNAPHGGCSSCLDQGGLLQAESKAFIPIQNGMA